jgi:hypothetical protein
MFNGFMRHSHTTKCKKMILGLYDQIFKQAFVLLQKAHTGLSILCLHGDRISGKSTLGSYLLQELGLDFEVTALSTISNDGASHFIRELSSLGNGLLTEYVLLDDDYVSAFLDFVSYIRLQEDGARRVWIIPSDKPMDVADFNIHVPALASDISTHSLICGAMVSGFALDANCPFMDLLKESTLGLSMGELSTLIKMVKSLAVAADKPLSCHHLNKAFRSLSYPAGHVKHVSTSREHMCDFTVSSSPIDRLDSFVGLSEDRRQLLQSYLDSPSGILLLTGPVGCGKSHLARLLAGNETVPYTRVTSADILKSKIGETEKSLFEVLSLNQRLIIEDIDKLVPEDPSETTGSVQRCLAVLVSFLDRVRFNEFKKDRIIIGTSRDEVDPRLLHKATCVRLDNKLSFEDKIKLIKSEYPQYDSSRVTAFDLINVGNRSQCIDFGNELKLKLLREVIHSKHLS